MSTRPRRFLFALGLLGAVAVPLMRRRLGFRVERAGGLTEVTLLHSPDALEVSPTGPASSVQEAEIVIVRELLDRIWTPEGLELIARGYWGFLRRISFGLIRIHYAPTSRTVTALGKLPLLRFAAPRYELAAEHARVTWPVEGGLLVAREGRDKGHLRVAISRLDRDGIDDEADAKLDRVTLIARVEVANFHPGLRGSGRFPRWGAWFYAQTQLRVHVIVCNAFLRTLPDLDFPDVDRTSMPSEYPAELEPVGG